MSRYLVRIPVAIKDDNGVGRLQVQPQTAGSGTQQEDKVLKRRVIEVLQERATVLSLGGSCRQNVFTEYCDQCEVCLFL